jgi:hypothetical protein
VTALYIDIVLLSKIYQESKIYLGRRRAELFNPYRLTKRSSAELILVVWQESKIYLGKSPNCRLVRPNSPAKVMNLKTNAIVILGLLVTEFL